MTAVTIADTRWTPGDIIAAHHPRKNPSDAPGQDPVLETQSASTDRKVTFTSLSDGQTYDAIDPQGHITRFRVDSTPADLQAQIDALDVRITSNQTSITNLSNDLAFEHGRINDLDARVSALEAAAP